VRGGRVQVMGRIFVIDHGSLVFDTGEADNPRLDVQATWRAPNDVLVRATVGGTAKDPILEWSSEPPLPGGEPEILALVLGGGHAGSAGAGLAGTILANEILSGTPLRGVEFYASTEGQNAGQGARLSEGTSNSVTAAVQLSDELWFEGSYETQTAGPDASQRQGVSGTLDWRFAPNWSARTEVGVLGFGLDLLWQYRY